ncbi:hypothetical protein QJS10_CPB12g00179 [Acorus calamus]|uniref:PWWP domain-containing protein n=1 Tax=Acorus calamus TaxID=4465 RepID=A0AAV9DRB8_ACOCL|nr:hypothetical protein QJS10_CPB12g00179 [Acorus calamus]
MAAETHNNSPSVAAVVEEATENGKLSGSFLEDGTLKPQSGHIQVVLIDESREGGVNGSDSTPPGENGTIGEGPEAPVTVDVAPTVEIDGGDVFVPGDLVWGENKSHQWLPGRVHDCSDASEHAETVRRDHGGRGPRLLVAYFDGTFAWCDHPLQQLKPFAEEYVRMSRQGDSKRFAKALDVALEDIARSVESEMSCACMPEVPKSMVRNAGIREGSVVVPYNRIDVGSFDSDGFLTKLRAVACDVSLCDGVEAAVLRGKVMAFYCRLGFGRLTAYGRSQGVMDKRKDRSMAELMAEMDVEHGNNTKEDSSDGPTSPMKKKWKKEKEEAKELEMMGIEGGGGGGDDGETGSSGLRKRKPSKYLSYPYTNVDHYNNKRWVPGGDDSEGEEEKKPKKGMKVSSPSSVSPRMEGQITGASPFVKCSGELLQKKSRKGQKTDGVSGGDVFGVYEEDWGSVDKMLIKMRSTALNVRYLMRDSASESQKKLKRAEKGEGENFGDGPAAVLMTFAPGVALPSKEDLLMMFSKFGELNVSETDVLKDSGCARIVFLKSSCAEVAFNNSGKIGSFKPGAVSYCLRYLPINGSYPEVFGSGGANGGELKVKEEENVKANASVKRKPQLEFVRQKLEMMMSILEDPHGQVGNNEGGLSPGMKEKLEKEMKGLLKKVNKLTGTSITTSTNASA